MNEYEFKNEVAQIQIDRLEILRCLYSNCPNPLPALSLSSGHRHKSLLKNLHYLERLKLIRIKRKRKNCDEWLVSIEPSGMDLLMGLSDCKGVADIRLFHHFSL